MAKYAVAVIGDENYIIPSVATALSARRNIERKDVDVNVYVVAEKKQIPIDDVRVRLASKELNVFFVEISSLDQLQTVHTDRSVPVSALSRLWLQHFLSEDIERFLYLDGDTLVGGPIDEIFDLAIPENGFLAADDCLCLYESEWRQPHRYWGEYIRSIGIEWKNYFNTGVLLVDRRGWDQMARQALEFLAANSHLCRSSDQTALNVVGRDHRARLPLRWNYQTEHMMIVDPREVGIKPAIWHFTGGPKPWEITEWPWGEEFNWAFRQAEELLRGLDLPRPPVNTVMFEEGRKHRQRQRSLQRWRFLYRRCTRARKIKAALV